MVPAQLMSRDPVRPAFITNKTPYAEGVLSALRYRGRLRLLINLQRG